MRSENINKLLENGFTVLQSHTTCRVFLNRMHE
jgi:hypothetical protein